MVLETVLIPGVHHHWSSTRVCTTDCNPLVFGRSASFQFTSLSAHLSHNSLALYEDLMGDSVKGLSEVQGDNIHYSSLIYQDRHFIIEDYRFGQGRLPLHESMLNTHNYLLVHHGPEKCFQIIYATTFPGIKARQTNL
ncbi:hypothetical protein llap_3464 [Limosa lapponica baueri]|uniref:Uncharacterized protein n=1 Tax=Limosa lapponica baueri TaxID=1758121 RepID=A0A2I0UJM4_LIMLA|nr:hypothetical protein llap_3464 [Limosa lapponica baueri]